MIGHDSGKRGNWYEEEYVVLQLLRLLNDQLQSVTWEVAYEDGVPPHDVSSLRSAHESRTLTTLCRTGHGTSMASNETWPPVQS